MPDDVQEARLLPCCETWLASTKTDDQAVWNWKAPMKRKGNGEIKGYMWRSLACSTDVIHSLSWTLVFYDISWKSLLTSLYARISMRHIPLNRTMRSFRFMHVHINFGVRYIKLVYFLKTPLTKTKRCSWGVKTPASYLWVPGFKSRPRHRLCWLTIFVVSLSPSRKIPVQYLKLGQDRFLSQPFKFIIHLLSFHLTLNHCY